MYTNEAKWLKAEWQCSDDYETACIGVASANAQPSPAKEMMEHLAKGLMPEEPATVVQNTVGIWTPMVPSEQDVADAKARDERRWKALRSVL